MLVVSKKLPTDWIIVTLVALIGVSCLIASHELNEEVASNQMEKLAE
jgi:hypothetical protein